MSGPDDPTTNKGQPLAEPNHRDPAPVARLVAPDGDHFTAAFAAASGTVSPELDLNGLLDEPGATGEDGDEGDRRAGS